MITSIENRIAPAAIVLVFLSAIPFGANRPWAWILFGLIAFALMAAQTIIDLTNRNAAAAALNKLGIVPWLGLAVLAWILFQSSGLPPEFLHHPIHFDLPSDIDHKSAISIIPERGYQYALRFGTYLALFWIIFRSTNQAARADSVMKWISAGYVLMALYTYFTLVTGLYKTHVLWFPHPWSGIAPSGTFVNQNHFAAFMALGALTIGGRTLMHYLSMEHRQINDKRAARSLRSREILKADFLTPAAAFILVSGCVLLANSIAATTSFLLALITLVLLCVRPRWVKAILSLPQRMGRTLVAAMLLGIGAAGLTALVIIGNSLIDDIDPFRVGIYQSIGAAIWGNAWLGTGSGTFAEAFAPYKGRIGANHTIDNAHNSFFQNMVELGLVASIALYFGLALLLARQISGVVTRRAGRWYPAVGLAVTLYASLHSLLDFSFELPAIAAMFAVIIAVTTHQSSPDKNRKRSKRRTNSDTDSDAPH